MKVARLCQALTSVSCARSSAAFLIAGQRAGEGAQEWDQRQQFGLEIAVLGTGFGRMMTG